MLIGMESKAQIGARQAWERRKAAAPALAVGRPLFRSDSVRSEQPWIDFLLVAGIVATRDSLVERGLSPAKAAAIVLWLQDQADRRRLIESARASSYRSELARVGGPSSTIPGYINSRAA